MVPGWWGDPAWGSSEGYHLQEAGTQGSLGFSAPPPYGRENMKEGKEKKKKNSHHREDLLGLPSWDITTAIARDPCQSFTKKNYQEKYITFS